MKDLTCHTQLRQGFTLIELMVVIAIIGILTSITLVSISSVRANNRDDQRLADLATIELALKQYASRNGDFPKEADGYSGGSGGNSEVGMICKSCSNPISQLVEQYVGFIPEDPLHQNNSNSYRYYYDGAHSCEGSETKAVLFAKTMERSSTNLGTLGCNGNLGGEGGSESGSAYIIILGPSSG